jgi:phthiodiolone/phenolphthiodiolone dimycocerosates ketoreductase
MSIGFGVGTQAPLAQVRGMTLLARALRADSVWMVDHWTGLFPQVIWDRDLTWTAGAGTSPDEFYDYAVLSGYLARRIGLRAQLAVGVTEPLRRHPVLIAQSALTLAHLTRRPPILGLGAGERENVEPYGLDFSRPVSVFEEAVQVIRLCLESRGTVDFTGEHFMLDGAILDLQAPPGRTPEIWIAAHGPRMLRLTGRYGDAWYPTFPMPPEVYADGLNRIRRAAREAGRDPEAIVPAMQVFVITAGTEAGARELLGSRAIRFAALLVGDEVWQRHGHTHPLGRGFRGMIDLVPQQFDRERLEEAIAEVPVELMEADAVWGTPDQVVAKIRALGEAGLQHVHLVPLSAMVSRRAAFETIRGMFTIARRLRTGG